MLFLIIFLEFINDETKNLFISVNPKSIFIRNVISQYAVVELLVTRLIIYIYYISIYYQNFISNEK